MMTSLRALPLPLYADEDTTLLKADCKRVLKKMEDKSVALIIVDPPYGGHTHNQQSWDVAWSDEEWTEIIREAYRVLIPGGHMIVFSSGKSTLDINMKLESKFDYKPEALLRVGTAQDMLGEEIFRDGQSCRTECFSDIRGRIAEAHICELRKAMAAITSDAKRLKTDAPVASKTDDTPIDKAAVDGTAVTGGSA